MNPLTDLPLLERLNTPPPCPHFHQRHCQWLSSRIGRLVPVSYAFCHQVCGLKDGPYCGREITPEHEQKFLQRAWARQSPVSSREFAERVIKRYEMAVDVFLPPEYPQFQELLAPLKQVPGFRKFLFTGSIQIKNAARPPKDYDVVLWFDSLESALPVYHNPPPNRLNGIPIDYFYYLGSQHGPPDMYFSCLDPEEKVLYTSRWFKLNLRSVYDGIRVVESPTPFANLLPEFLSRPPAPEIEARVQAGQNWQVAKSSWEKAKSFIDAAESRGLVATAAQALGFSDSKGERVDEATYRLRYQSCFGGEGKAPCGFLRKGAQFHYCSSCGCGETELARLDGPPGKYTKLHYPELKCPLGKPGFSNHQPTPLPAYQQGLESVKLSVVIPVLNDLAEVRATVASIRATSPASEVEVIVIDDHSDTPVDGLLPGTVLRRTPHRIGPGAARHLGVTLAHAPYCLLLDSHMRFVPGWYEKAMTRIWGRNKTMHNAACLGLSEHSMDLNNYVGFYLGADLVLWEPEGNKVFEGVWAKDRGTDDHELSCVMGANYFVPKDFFLHVGGLAGNRLWGSEEPFLAIKFWLAGGEVRLMREVHIGHKFRDNASYATPTHFLPYNKLRFMRVCLPDKMFEVLAGRLKFESGFYDAVRLVNQHAAEIERERADTQSKFVHDIEWLIQKFKLRHPLA